jgi:hypothetical protein
MTSGMKFDTGKVDWSLLEPLIPILESTVKVLMHGEKKYARNNWQRVKPTRRYYSAMTRHLIQNKSEYLDRESGLPHWAHAMCDALFIAWQEEQKWKKKNKQKK